LFILLGVLLARSGFQTLRNAGTEVNPTKPTTTLVVSGPYQVTRNPLYLSLTLFYAGISLLANAFAALLLLPIVLFIINRGVIDREERYLEQKFGDEYLRYKMRVPRWF
jgi:protein-S-isoprenylcysteine O-methyltransferase Ste14